MVVKSCFECVLGAPNVLCHGVVRSDGCFVYDCLIEALSCHGAVVFVYTVELSCRWVFRRVVKDAFVVVVNNCAHILGATVADFDVVSVYYFV